VDVTVVARYESTRPPDDTHPYRTGAWLPNLVEYDAVDCDVIGELPDDLDGVYLRNTENPLHDSLGRYHPFDGDGMLHSIRFGNGAASYRNRFIRTAGFETELAEGRPLWAGLAESPAKSIDPRGWGARGRMKDSSSTDVVVHGGRALTSFYQCGDLYRLDPVSLDQLGPETWRGAFPPEGVSAHPKVDEHTGELLFFNYSTTAPYMHYGVVDASGELVHYTPVALPGARLPHDMAFTEHYAILNDCPMFWDPDLLARGVHAVRFHPEMPTRFGVIPRRGGPADVRWFEAEATYVLHWINAFEDGDEVVLDGYFQHDPSPRVDPSGTPLDRMLRYLDNQVLRPTPHRWRFNLATGATKEEPLSDELLEFGMVNGRHAGRPYRYVYNMTNTPGWFLFNGIVRLDVHTGERQEYRFDDGVYASESPMAPSTSSASEDDGYVVTFTTDMVNDRSECLVFDASAIADGPIARVRLPERISSGTHSCWVPATDLAPSFRNG